MNYKLLSITLCSVLSLQAMPHTFTPENNAANVVAPGVSYAQGITLQDHNTSCRYASTQPLSGPLRLNGGTLFLDNNVSSTRSMMLSTAGTIDGQGYTLELPQQMVSWMAPQMNHYAGMTIEQPFISEAAPGGVDWQRSHDMTKQPFFISASADASKHSTVSVAFGHEMSAVAFPTLPGNAQRIKWRPHHHDGAVSFSEAVDGSTVHAFTFDQATGQITTTSLRSHQGEITALAWSPHGNRLAVAEYNASAALGKKVSLTIYEWRAGEIELVDTVFLPGHVDATTHESRGLIHACAWRDDAVLVVGRGSDPVEPQVAVYQVDHVGRVHMRSAFRTNSHVSAVAFVPGHEICLIGLVGGGGQYRLLSCAITNAEGVAHHQQPMQYPVTEDVYEIAFFADGSLLAIETYTGTHEEGSGLITLYQARIEGGPTLHIDQCNHYPHADLCRELVWAPHEPLLCALDVKQQLLRATVSRGLSLKNISVVGNSPLEWRGGLSLSGEVIIDGQGYSWQLPEYSWWRLAAGAQVSVRNAHIDARSDFYLGGAESSTCTFDNCRIGGGTFYCQAPMRFSGQTRMQASIVGECVLPAHATVMLEGSSSWTGTIRVQGNVVVMGNGNELNVRGARIELVDGAQLHFMNTRVIGLDQWQAAATSTMRFTDSALELAQVGAYERGQIGIMNSSVSYQSERRQVASASFVAGSDTSLWEAVRASGTDSGGSVPVPPVPGVPSTPGAGPIIITTDEYVLDHDLILSTSRPLEVRQNTTIRGNGHAIRCARTMEPLITVSPGVTLTVVDTAIEALVPRAIQGGHGAKVVWGRNALVSLQGSTELSIAWHCKDNAHIDGNLHEISLDDLNTLCVEKNADVTLQRLRIGGVSGQRLHAQGRESNICLYDTVIQLVGNAQLMQGKWRIKGKSAVRGGGFSLTYASTMPLSIAGGAQLVLRNGVRFICEPVNGRQDILQLMPEGTLVLDNSAFESRLTSLRIPEGRVVLRGHVELRQKDGGELMFGSQDNLTSVTLLPEPGSFAHLYGHISLTLAPTV